MFNGPLMLTKSFEFFMYELNLLKMLGWVQYEWYRWSNSYQSSLVSLLIRSDLMSSAGIMQEMMVSIAMTVLT